MSDRQTNVKSPSKTPTQSKSLGKGEEAASGPSKRRTATEKAKGLSLELSTALQTVTAEELARVRRLALGKSPTPKQTASKPTGNGRRPKSRKEARDPFEAVLHDKLAEHVHKSRRSTNATHSLIVTDPLLSSDVRSCLAAETSSKQDPRHDPRLRKTIGAEALFPVSGLGCLPQADEEACGRVCRSVLKGELQRSGKQNDSQSKRSCKPSRAGHRASSIHKPTESELAANLVLNMSQKWVKQPRKKPATTTAKPRRPKDPKDPKDRPTPSRPRLKTLTAESLNFAALLDSKIEGRGSATKPEQPHVGTRQAKGQMRPSEVHSEKKVFVNANNSYIHNLNISPAGISYYEPLDNSSSGAKERAFRAEVGSEKEREPEVVVRMKKAARSLELQLKDVGEQATRSGCGDALAAYKTAFDAVVNAETPFTPVLKLIQDAYNNRIETLANAQARQADALRKAKLREEKDQARIQTLEQEVTHKQEELNNQARKNQELKDIITEMLKSPSNVQQPMPLANSGTTPTRVCNPNRQHNDRAHKTEGHVVPPLDLSKIHLDDSEGTEENPPPAQETSGHSQSLGNGLEHGANSEPNINVPGSSSSASSADSQAREHEVHNAPNTRTGVPRLNMAALVAPKDPSHPKQRPFRQYHEEFMDKFEEFSPSWRKAILQDKR